LFESEVDAHITFSFGFFGSAACRKVDRDRADGLDLKGMLLANDRATVLHKAIGLW